MTSFPQVCEALDRIRGNRKAVATYIASVVADPEVRRYFQLAVDPAIQFYLDLPQTEQPDDATLGVEDFERLIDRAQPCTAPERFGKWSTRILTKKLNLGVGPATLNVAWPGLISEFPVMERDRIVLGQGEEGWTSLIHHLEDARNWFVQGDPYGIRCLMTLKTDGRVLPKLPSGLPVTKLQDLEDELRRYVSGTKRVLDGRLVVPGVVNQKELFDAILGGSNQVQYHVQDERILDTPFTVRQTLVETIVETDRIKRPLVFPANFDDTAQVQALRSQGYKAALLYYGPGTYVMGVSRNVLSFNLG